MPIVTERSPIALIVDNDVHARAGIERYLSARGVVFDTASDPRSAIERLSGSSYDCLFLDLDLGAGLTDGEGVLAWMRRHEIATPTVLLSEAANMPSVIRLEKAYGFVKLRMTHQDLQDLSGLVDELMQALEVHPSMEARASESSNAKVDNGEPTGRHRVNLVLVMVLAFVIIVLVLAIVMRWLPGASFAAISATAILLLTLILVGFLFEQGKLSETGFLAVVKDVLHQLRGRRRGQ